MKLLIEARNLARVPQGLVENWSAATIVVRFNGVGTYSVAIPTASLDAFTTAVLAAGGGLRISDDDTGQLVIGGPIMKVTHAWGEDNRYGGVLTVEGVSDLIHVQDRITYPTPSAVWTAQNVTAYYTTSGPAETVVRALINVNLGPAAVDARQAGLTIPADGGRGATVKINTRFENLLDVCASAALASGINLGFDVTAGTSGGLALAFRVPTVAPVLLSQDAGTVRSGTAITEAPSITRALVAGQGEGTARSTREVGRSGQEGTWGRRIESLVDRRDTADTDTLDQAGDESVTEGSQKFGYTVAVADQALCQYLVDYRLGDVVAYEPVQDLELADVVREVKIEAGGGDCRITPTVGPADTTTTPDLRKRVRSIERALRKLHGAP